MHEHVPKGTVRENAHVCLCCCYVKGDGRLDSHTYLRCFQNGRVVKYEHEYLSHQAASHKSFYLFQYQQMCRE